MIFLDFFLSLREAGLPVSLRDYYTLLQALDKQVVEHDVTDFYYLCRSVFVKKETYLDRFDVLFGAYFQGIESIPDEEFRTIPEEWLKKNSENFLTPEEMEKIRKWGNLDELRERFKELLEEQKERHEGGSKWIGTGGTSPFGAYGYNPEGFRIGQDRSRHRKAVKVWDERKFSNLSGDAEIGTRTIKMALKRLRLLTREGVPEEFDLDGTIRSTARNAGVLDIKEVPKLRNNVKVLLFLDAGGSMDDYVDIAERLFSAAKYEFKHLEYYYFHNCLYEYVWKDNSRRYKEKIPTWEIFNRFNSDYKVIVLGDASMSPYEISYPGGSVEHWNEGAGAVWLHRLRKKFPSSVWLNPVPTIFWRDTHSIGMIRDIFADKMYPLTLSGLEDAIRELKNPASART